MDLQLGSWLLSPDGELIGIGHTLADGECFADCARTVHQIIHPDDDQHARLLRGHFNGDEEPTDVLLVATDRVTPDGCIFMRVVPPPGESC